MTTSKLVKMAESTKKGRKHCGKRKKLLITSNFFLFPQCFQKTCTADMWKQGLVRERVMSLILIKSYNRHVLWIKMKLLIKMFFTSHKINPLPHNPNFQWSWRSILFKKLWEMDKFTFSFSHNAFSLSTAHPVSNMKICLLQVLSISCL